MSFTVIIPARLDSSRLPEKLLQLIGEKTVIEHVVDRANKSRANNIVVATDSEKIRQRLGNAICDVVMTSEHHLSGTDRLAQAVEKMELTDNEVVVNIQGDEPFIPPQLIDDVADTLKEKSFASMTTAAHSIEDAHQFEDPNAVKVVLDHNDYALYFSRAGIPFSREKGEVNGLKHIGIYAYTVAYLRQYAKLPACYLEETEKLEQLRTLVNGDKIAVRVINYDAGIGIDTMADLVLARERYAQGL